MENRVFFSMTGRPFKILKTWDGFQAFTIDQVPARTETRRTFADCYVQAKEDHWQKIFAVEGGI